jgi:type I restriction enzyme S subunit
MEKVFLTEICSPKQWKTISGEEILKKGKYPVYGANGKIGYYDDFNHEESILAIGCRGTCGSLHITQKFSYTSGNAMALDNLSSKVDIKYLYHYLFFRKFDDIISGGVQKQITKEGLKKIQIPLPDIPSQQKIAAILDKADELRQYNKQLIEKYDALTQSLFLDMFGDPVRNEKKFFKSTIGEQCSVKGGKRVPKNEKLVKDNTGYPYIKAGNIKKGKVTTKDLEYLLPTTREKLKRYIVNEGDVCITVVGVNIGDIGIVPKELHNANLTENANKLLIKNANLLNSFYLASYLQMDFIQKDISKKTMAVGVPKLALFRIEQLELLLPPIELQLKFQEQVESIETQKKQAQEALVKSEALFQGLSQQAFKGEFS